MIPIKKLHSVLLSVVLLPFAFSARANPDDFTVKSVEGDKTFKLSESKGKYVALHFLLKTECPYCLRHTRDYARRSAGDSRVIHIFLKPDTDEEIRRWAGQLGDAASAPAIYRDPDAKLAEAFGIPDGYAFHGQTVRYPGLVLLDPAGKEVFRYIGKSNTDRLSYDKFAAKLDELAKPASPRRSQARIKYEHRL